MFFITNRIPKEGLKTEVGRDISFDPQTVTAAQDVFFCEANRSIGNPYTYKEIGNSKFFSTLKSRNCKQILFFLHGFNNTVEDALDKALNLQHFLQKASVFVVPLIWPCDDDNALAILDDYYDDQVAASASNIAFARVIGKFYDWGWQKEICDKRLNILAHSMGNLVLIEALKYWVHHYSHRKQIPLLFRNIFMVAADVPNQALEAGEDGQYVPQSTRNTVVYYASDDLMLSASKFANIRHHEWGRRLGITGPENMNKVPKNVYEVDCDDFNKDFDTFKGHTYFLGKDDNLDEPSPMINHIATALGTGRIEPSDRSYRLS